MIPKKLLVIAAAALFALSGGAFAQGPMFGRMEPPKPTPFVSPLFSDNMVLQRGKPNTIWGWSEPGDKVQVEIAGKTASAVTGADRRWQVKINPPAVGGPYTVHITGPQTVELKNVLVGDVWICGGQSNMGVPLMQTRNGAEDAKAATDPEIRFFSVMQRVAYKPVNENPFQGSWTIVSPETAGRVSAVAYYFAHRVRQDMHIPIGLIIDNVGGTPAESWTSAEGVRALKDFDVPLAEVEHLASIGAHEYGDYISSWYDVNDIGQKEKWESPDLNDSDWKPVDLVGGFKALGVPEKPSLVWFRKEIVLPDPLPAGRATIYLGAIERMDTVYLNGNKLGGSSWVENPRVYPLFRQGILKPGRNVLAIRVLKTKPDGGFLNKPEDLRMTIGDSTTIPLANDWKAKLSVDASKPELLPIRYENWPVMPAVLYNGMIKPLAPLSIAGAIWYQGEQNSERGIQYRRVLPAMIADWRKTFGQGNFPFYIVSLPFYNQRRTAPADDTWAELRESQSITAATVPNTCLAVTIDTGDQNNLHPPEKKPVGDRLGLCALANYYGKHVVFQGPALSSVDRLPNSIRLHFAHADGGLVVKGDKLGEFSIAGDDHKWYWADAKIEGNTVVVSSPSVPNPREVRYAWQSNPMATLFNGAGLPADPFRTDRWPGITENVRPY